MTQGEVKVRVESELVESLWEKTAMLDVRIIFHGEDIFVHPNIFKGFVKSLDLKIEQNIWWDTGDWSRLARQDFLSLG